MEKKGSDPYSFFGDPPLSVIPEIGNRESTLSVIAGLAWRSHFAQMLFVPQDRIIQ